MSLPFLSVEVKHIKGSHFGKRIGPKRLSAAFWTQGCTQATVPRVVTPLVASFMLSRQQSKSISFLLHSNGCHGFGLEGCCDRDPTHRCPAENRESTLCRLSSGRRRKLKLPVNRVLEQEELGLCLTRVSSLHRAKWEKGPGEAGALVLSWMVNEAAEKGDQISWLCKLKTQIRKRIALLGGFSHPILWGFV